jgi:hypothetical protein
MLISLAFPRFMHQSPIHGDLLLAGEELRGEAGDAEADFVDVEGFGDGFESLDLHPNLPMAGGDVRGMVGDDGVVDGELDGTGGDARCTSTGRSPS